MARYLCQFCNYIGTDGDNHICFFYKNDDKVHSVPLLQESDKKHDAKNKFTKNLNDNSDNFCPAVQQNEIIKSEQMRSQLIESNCKISFMPVSKRNLKNSILSEEMSSNAEPKNLRDISIPDSFLNVQAREYHFTRNSSLKAPPKIAEPDCRYESEFPAFSNRKSVAIASVSEQKELVAYNSNLLPSTSNEEFEKTLEDKKWQILNNDKKLFMDSLECAIQTSRLNNKIISENRNLNLNSDFTPGNKEPDNNMIKVSGDLRDVYISPEAPSQVHSMSKPMAGNMKEPIYSLKDDNGLAGPSEIRSLKKKFPCGLSTKIFNRNDMLDNHYGTHTGKKPFVCGICEKQFSVKVSLERHIKLHTGENLFVCDKCGKTYTSKQALNIHYRTHTGEKPYVCGICEKKFAQKVNLQSHTKIHTGENLFVCDKCGRKYTQKTSLNIHYRIHTGDKPFVCDKCGKQFTQKANLDSHNRTHTGEKPYKCADCGRAFTTSSNCKTHQRRMHDKN